MRWCGGAVVRWRDGRSRRRPTSPLRWRSSCWSATGHPCDDRRRAAGPHHPLQRTPARSDCDGADSPLHRLEHRLHGPVGFVILPLFGLANAGVPILGLPAGALLSPVTLGVGVGLLLGKVVGVFGMTSLAVRFGLADRPAHASQSQLFGMALLCGIGFTMSIFITLLAFPGDPLLQAEAKIGVLMESILSGLLGYSVLRRAHREG
ncbi:MULTISPECIES: Na+/H+ antiporter NhaA [unclassified Sphingomonas]|uniref:Na+/H+ antiporter NhaA n=1 Tax=Sphingomonas sp. TaxID=28214 RepID=UPI0032E40573